MRSWRTLLTVPLVLGSLLIPAAAVGAVDDPGAASKKTSGDLAFVVYGITDPYVPGDDVTIEPAGPGMRLVAVDVEVFNDTRRPKRWSPERLAQMIAARSGSNQTVSAVASLPSLEEAIPGGSSWRGLVIFEVPVNRSVRSVRLRGSAAEKGVVVALAGKKGSPAPSKRGTTYAATGGGPEVTITGTVKALDAQFELEGVFPGGSATFTYTPTDDRSGRYVANLAGSGATGQVTGTYRIEGESAGPLTLTQTGSGCVDGVPGSCRDTTEVITLTPQR